MLNIDAPHNQLIDWTLFMRWMCMGHNAHNILPVARICTHMHAKWSLDWPYFQLNIFAHDVSTSFSFRPCFDPRETHSSQEGIQFCITSPSLWPFKNGAQVHQWWHPICSHHRSPGKFSIWWLRTKASWTTFGNRKRQPPSFWNLAMTPNNWTIFNDYPTILSDAYPSKSLNIFLLILTGPKCSKEISSDQECLKPTKANLSIEVVEYMKDLHPWHSDTCFTVLSMIKKYIQYISSHQNVIDRHDVDASTFRY